MKLSWAAAVSLLGSSMARASSPHVPFCNTTQLHNLGQQFVSSHQIMVQNCIPLDLVATKDSFTIMGQTDCRMTPKEKVSRLKACKQGTQLHTKAKARYQDAIQCRPKNMNDHLYIMDLAEALEKQRLANGESVSHEIDRIAQSSLSTPDEAEFSTHHMAAQTCPPYPSVPLRVAARPTGIQKKKSKAGQHSKTQLSKHATTTATAKSTASPKKPTKTHSMVITPAPLKSRKRY